MPPDRTIKLYDWIIEEFSVSARQARVAQLAPHLGALLRAGDRVLDLCCGTGPFAFWCEEQGARVTAIDMAPPMIARARAEAEQRRSKVDFVLGDVLVYDFGQAKYDLVLLLGSTISDFSHAEFARLGERIRAVLGPGGHFAVHYDDGIAPFIGGTYKRIAVQQDGPPRISRAFGRYLPDEAALTETYRNEATGEEYEYRSSLYTPALVQADLRGVFAREHHITLGDQGYLDFFIAPLAGIPAQN